MLYFLAASVREQAKFGKALQDLRSRMEALEATCKSRYVGATAREIVVPKFPIFEDLRLYEEAKENPPTEVSFSRECMKLIFDTFHRGIELLE